MATSAPPDSLVEYSAPILIPDGNVESKMNGDSIRSLDLSKCTQIDEILDTILPPQIWQDQKGLWMRHASTRPCTRFDVTKLQERMDASFSQRQARESGICIVREDMYSQCFDEIIRQVTIDNFEQALLLVRVRDELRLTLDAYKALFDSSNLFSIRKQLQAEKMTFGLIEQVDTLAEEKRENEYKVSMLKTKLDLIEKRATERRFLQDKKHKEETDYLKYQGQHLEAFLKAAGSSGLMSMKK